MDINSALLKEINFFDNIFVNMLEYYFLKGFFKNVSKVMNVNSGPSCVFHNKKTVIININTCFSFQKVANSWGKDWGEDGYFRIVRGRDESEIESFVIAAWPEIARRSYPRIPLPQTPDVY